MSELDDHIKHLIIGLLGGHITQESNPELYDDGQLFMDIRWAWQADPEWMRQRLRDTQLSFHLRQWLITMGFLSNADDFLEVLAKTSTHYEANAHSRELVTKLLTGERTEDEVEHLKELICVVEMLDSEWLAHILMNPIYDPAFRYTIADRMHSVSGPILRAALSKEKSSVP